MSGGSGISILSLCQSTVYHRLHQDPTLTVKAPTRVLLGRRIEIIKR